MKNYLSIIFIGILMSLHYSSMAQDARAIVARMEQNMRGNSTITEMEMEVVRPRFSRKVGIKSWAVGEDYAMILITSPARDRGTAYLKRYREIWNWLPSIERTIKLPPSMMSQSWMGSDFTNDDLVRESSTINDYEHEISGTTLLDGYECHIIMMTPKPDAAVVFGKVQLYITKESYLNLRTENYDEGGNLVSVIEGSEIREMGGRQIPSILTMTPADKPNQKTLLRYISLEFDKEIDPGFFSLQNMRNLR
jgi:outer membrane lipoprotein-sorting protein